MPTEPDFWSSLKSLTERGLHVKLGPGVVSKTTRVVLALCLVWAVIFYKMSGTWADVGLLIGGAILTAFVFWWTNKTHEFAEKNPGTALLDGAHLLQWQRFQQEAKGLPPSDTGKMVVAEPQELPRE